jgi:NAD(P)-dependent dehydrogenase (short-subunit alcohol dehydrogenase family)
MPGIQGRTAVVTGAGSRRGIGRATAHALAAQGWHVAVLDVDRAGVQDRATEVAQAHGIQESTYLTGATYDINGGSHIH